MDLRFSVDEISFRDEARTWLEENKPKEKWPSMDTEIGFEQHRNWERNLYDSKWSVPNWPAEYGGRNCSLIEWLLFEEEYYLSGAPGRVNTNGITLLGPTLFEWGSEKQKNRFLPAMAAGEEIWAQGWSEPNTGSDLASLSTTAVLDGENYVVNGQKTWCSRGAWADWIFCIVRTDPASQRHSGLSYLLVPANTSGLTRRPVSRLDGEPAFAELFFDDCLVHVDNRLGDEGAGWNVAMATASSERGLNLRAPGRFLAAATQLVGLYRALLDEKNEIPQELRNEVVDGYVAAQAYRWQVFSKASALMHGSNMGAEASYMKIFWSELDVDLHATALRLLADQAELVLDAPDAYSEGSWMSGYLFSLAGPIYAGTNEIQRNIVAERVLGLPRK
ncbi:MAG: acyl-CoA dehydrogenase family protein [Acidimicrobiales bacterium]|nr:acyl-CoA dehydrogenase family protein [Acidimicrobiales bacterium]|tara:strand:- start:31216 stop:32385 length:1170 start_codon:yes stop_codon:yes gene_type:complete